MSENRESKCLSAACWQCHEKAVHGEMCHGQATHLQPEDDWHAGAHAALCFVIRIEHTAAVLWVDREVARVRDVGEHQIARTCTRAR